jgi:hypothetical protein
MARVARIVQLFMLAACVMTFTSARQAGALLGLRPIAPIQNAPAPQEDDSEKTEEIGRAKDRASRPRIDSCSNRVLHLLPPLVCAAPRQEPVTAPTPVDHFRNGLGSPYRC